MNTRRSRRVKALSVKKLQNESNEESIVIELSDSQQVISSEGEVFSPRKKIKVNVISDNESAVEVDNEIAESENSKKSPKKKSKITVESENECLVEESVIQESQKVKKSPKKKCKVIGNCETASKEENDSGIIDPQNKKSYPKRNSKKVKSPSKNNDVSVEESSDFVEESKILNEPLCFKSSSTEIIIDSDSAEEEIQIVPSVLKEDAESIRIVDKNDVKKTNVVNINEEQALDDSNNEIENEIINENIASYQISSDDEEPEDICLKTSKDKILEQNKQQKEMLNMLKEKKKALTKERDNRNVIQQQEKQVVKKKSLVPEKLNDYILKEIDMEVDISNKILTSKKHQNQKIVFPNDDEEEEDCEEDFDFDIVDDESDSIKQRGANIKPIILKDVEKDHNINSARDFLAQHLYGGRVNRVKLNGKFNDKRKSNYTNKEVVVKKKRGK